MANLNHPANLKYSKTDEWVRVEGDEAYIGITDYAQDQLGDIVYIELPWDQHATVSYETKFGDIESVKATSELLSPLNPYEDGWMLVVKVANPAELDHLMSAEQYKEFLQAR